ncbi:MAG: LysM peptidoglycan-binding domain-containing protein, partial [Aggregatilineales bacterium]
AAASSPSALPSSSSFIPRSTSPLRLLRAPLLLRRELYRLATAAPPAAPPAQATAPVDPATLPTPIQLTERVYTVVAGDTLGAIARKFGITVQQLRQANGLLEGDFIRVGQQLKIPAPQ